jgi:protein TonB
VLLPPPGPDVYSPDEIAHAAGVPLQAVVAEIGRPDALVTFATAVQIGRTLARRTRRAAPSQPLFSMFSSDERPARATSVPLAVSSTLHLAVLAAISAALGLTSKAATLPMPDHPAEPLRLVFLTTPGPGGGGGGGGLLQKTPAPKALREGHSRISSPLPLRQPSKGNMAPAPPRPAPLKAEQLPAIVAPVLTIPADARDRRGVFEESLTEIDSHGSGRGGGVGTGTGTGIGEGAGPGIGPGSGGGVGGGPYRPGTGITPPRLLREVKADYTELARRRGIEGDVVLEIVVRSDGSVGDVRVRQGLEPGLNERATQAVRQWRFAPALRQGVAIDVIVEAAVEFRLR